MISIFGCTFETPRHWTPRSLKHNTNSLARRIAPHPPLLRPLAIFLSRCNNSLPTIRSPRSALTPRNAAKLQGTDALNATFNGDRKIYGLIFPSGRQRSSASKFPRLCSSHEFNSADKSGHGVRAGGDLTKIHVLVCPSSITW